MMVAAPDTFVIEHVFIYYNNLPTAELMPPQRPLSEDSANKLMFEPSSFVGRPETNQISCTRCIYRSAENNLDKDLRTTTRT